MIFNDIFHRRAMAVRGVALGVGRDSRDSTERSNRAVTRRARDTA
jgi:hypothetical protein